MKFSLYLALRNLLRHPGRNFLYVLGVSITAALLLDMILLSSGLKISLQRALTRMGWEIRLSPRGTLPFETDAQVMRFAELQKQIARTADVEAVDGMLGTTVSAQFQDHTFSSFIVGLQLHRPILYRMIEGAEPAIGKNEVMINQQIGKALNIHPGDKLKLWIGSSAQATGIADVTEVVVSGVVIFSLDAEGQYTITSSLPLLQEMMRQRADDPVSLVMIKLKDPKQAEAVAGKINHSFPQVSAYTIHSVVEAVDSQLSYFKQFGLILGGISLIVTFVLVFIITTISFHDRVGEIALLRAIGIGNRTIFTTILFEGILTSIASAVLGFALGKLAALYLDAVLKSAPGLPEDFSFFIFEPASVIRALITLLATGFFAGLYPASAAIRLPVAGTLREEIL